jgi:hypothetical protein
MARTLPPQNAVAVGAISAVIGFLAAWLSNLAGFPLGRRVYPGGLAWSIDGVPLAWAFLWVTVVVLGQGLARLLLRPWRGSLHHGLWLMVAGVLLAMHLELGLEPFAVRVAGWWHYQKLPGVPHWYSAPVVNVLGWGLTALAAWLATFPWFLRKQLGDPPRDGFFLALWVVIQTWLIGEAIAHRLWLAAVVTAAGIVVVTVVAMHALRHAKSEGD